MHSWRLLGGRLEEILTFLSNSKFHSDSMNLDEFNFVIYCNKTNDNWKILWQPIIINSLIKNAPFLFAYMLVHIKVSKPTIGECYTTAQM